jgi:tripartite-type tricarboxylate transporter receptor subunit TctC
MKLRKLGLLSLALAALACGPLHAQNYPAKPVRVIVPFEPGAGADFVTRTFTPGLSEVFKQPFVVDNRGGATGAIGVNLAARAAPDGYTLLTISGTHAINQAIAKGASSYNLSRDFDMIALYASTPWILAVHPSIPAKTVKELLAYAKTRPGQLTFGSSGQGGGTHLAGEMLKIQGGIDMLHVPYKGTAPAITDLVGGRISMMFASQVMPQVKAGRVRALAITSSERSPMAPDIPTMIESGFPGFVVGAWFSMAAPAGTSPQIIRSLNSAVTKIAQNKEIQDRLMVQSSAEPMMGPPEKANAYVRADIRRWSDIIAKTGIDLK